MTRAKGKASRKMALFMSFAMAVPFAGPIGSVYAREVNETAEQIANKYADEGYSLVWNDEFDGTELNLDEWNLEEHEPGWVNQELQAYGDPDNIEVSDGKLTIYPKAVKKEKAAGEVDVFEGAGFDGSWSGATSVENGVATVEVTNVGTNAWDVQFQKAGMTLTQGHEYKFVFKASALEAKTMQVSATNTATYVPYADMKETLGTTETVYELPFTMGACEDGKFAIQINLGNFNDATSVPTTVTLSDAKLIDLSESGSSAGIVVDGIDDSFSGATSIADGVATIDVTDVGTNAWDVQVQKAGMTLTEGHEYKLSFTGKAEAAKTIQVSATNTATYVPYADMKETLGTEEDDYDLTFTMGACEDEKFAIQFNLGNFNDATSVATTVTLSNLTLVDLTEAEANPDEVNIKTDYEYTSGRISTQNKEDFVYGRFESRIRVPKGMGYLPAFWLMATDEDDYGPWPQCGEIDIMEVMGQDTSLSYHTIHYGYNTGSGHKEQQGKYKIEEGDDFYEDYHIYTLDWEPGKLTWYVDGIQVFETSEWCTGADEESELTYPAPYDHELYVILNLAIGGGWVGYPDQEAVDDMNNQSMDVDYVRVYQKDWSVYEEQEKTCVRPEKIITVREPDDNGNFVVNGDFSEDLKEMGSKDDNFELHLESDCKDNTAYNIANNVITITPGAEGSLDYSMQLKQIGIPMYRGYEYELSFDAYADEARTIIVDIEGPDNGYVRYFGDETVELGTDATNQHYSFTFTMDAKSDMNGSLEFNLGNQGSTAPVHISNVSVKHVGGEEIVDDERGLTGDGNYVFNGTFDQGEERLGYWDVVQFEDDESSVSVSNTLDEENVRTRELGVEIVVPETGIYQIPVIVAQTGLSPIAKGRYKLSFDAYAGDGAPDGMKVCVANKKYLPELTNEAQTYTFNIEFDENVSADDSFISFLFYKPGTYYMDNVRLVEDAMIKNGSFDSGDAGFAFGVYGSGVASGSVLDEVDGHDTVFCAAIENLGSADWNVQFKSSATTLEEGKYYKLSFDAMSTIPRQISVCMQHDGSSDDNWDSYDGDDKIYEVTDSWQTFGKVFQMEKATDSKVLFSAAIGNLGEEVDAHELYFDNITLIEVDENGDPLPGSEISEEDTTDDLFRLPRLTWVELPDGKYIYLNEKEEMVKDAYIKGYYLDKDGYWDGEKKVVGWTKDADGWRYMLKGGDCLKNTWKQIDCKWYYFDANGVMEANAYRNGYYLTLSGAWDGKAKVPGWITTDTVIASWKYCIGEDTYATKWTKIDGKWYYFHAEGFMSSECFVQGYWLGKNGAMTNFAKCSWHKSSKGWWYGNSTWYATSTYMIDGDPCTFETDGYYIEAK